MLLLASASPRRKELLINAGFAFTVHSVPVDETAHPHESAAALAVRLATAKARATWQSASPDPAFPRAGLAVLGADTLVTIDQHILGKPADTNDAQRMLRLLSGRTHQVITAVALVTAIGEQTAFETTQVEFLTLSEAEIAAYIATGEPMDKAGAYAIQGHASRWIPRIRGCYFNVVGLPIALVSTMLESLPDPAIARTVAN